MPDLRPPGPRGPENLAFVRLMRQGAMQMFGELSARYGEVSVVQVTPRLKLCLVLDPALIQRILVNDNAKFKKGRFLELAKDLLGEGLLTSSGEHHKRQRMLIQPMFHRQMIRGYADIMVDWSEKFADRWSDGQTFDLAREMTKLTLAIVGETLFGANVEEDAADVGHALEQVLDIGIINRPLKMLTRNWQRPGGNPKLEARALLYRTIQKVIDSHRSGSDGHTLVHLLLEARDENGQGMSDELVRDEALTLFLAGHETTANALAWTWYLLSQHPRAEAMFHQELDQVLGGRAPTVDDLPKLTYTRQLLTESMRLYPPAWTLGRRTLEDYALGRWVLPKGSIIVMSQFYVHRSPRFFSDPLSFRPERWTPEFKRDLPKFAYFPFSGGPRNCIGEAFAWMEGTLLLATLGQRWKFSLLPGQRVEPKPMVTLRPRDGLQMRAEARRPAPILAQV